MRRDRGWWLGLVCSAWILVAAGGCRTTGRSAYTYYFERVDRGTEQFEREGYSPYEDERIRADMSASYKTVGLTIENRSEKRLNTLWDEGIRGPTRATRRIIGCLTRTGRCGQRRFDRGRRVRV